MAIKVQFYNIAPEGAILHLVLQSDLVNRDHKSPILGAEEWGTYHIPLVLHSCIWLQRSCCVALVLCV